MARTIAEIPVRVEAAHLNGGTATVDLSSPYMACKSCDVTLPSGVFGDVRMGQVFRVLVVDPEADQGEAR